ncbi:cell division inhibitor SepF [Sinosporangium album]|uniref:Cell division protein SepF n=1 Tax=Sinosporangium album TaxID=504805 RepID=A0A1G8CG28_9ACTN|nr:cell division protein SepF [Sinosporangium album]SDH44425.1 cell division inhibitor SepF [Sinosporangium album]
MGTVRKVASYLGLGGADEYDDVYDDDDVEYEEWAPASERAAKRWGSVSTPSKILMIQPRKYNSDAPLIGRHFRDGQAVILDVSDMPAPDATRMVDFAAGLAFGCEGRIDRIAEKVFLLAPSTVEVDLL